MRQSRNRQLHGLSHLLDAARKRKREEEDDDIEKTAEDVIEVLTSDDEFDDEGFQDTDSEIPTDAIRKDLEPLVRASPSFIMRY